MTSVHQNSSKQPRLLIILNRFVIGGQAVDTIPLAWHLQDKFDILILYGEKEKDELEAAYLLEKYAGLRLKKIRHLRRSINPLIDVLAFFSILFTIAKFKAHIVHTHGAKSGFVGRLAAWLLGIPVIIHTFHGHFFHSYFSKKISRFIAFIERLMGKLTTAAVALSSTQKKELTELFKILPASKIAIIPLGFAFDKNNDVEALRKNFRRRYDLSDNDVAIGIVGRIVPVKNHLFFVEVIKSLSVQQTKNPPAFFIIGDGELRHEVEKQMHRYDISFNEQGITPANKVVFTSWLTNMYEVMNGLDIVALTSLNEGTPLSIIEAEFFKRPVISTDAGGVRDTMLDRVSGFLTAQHNVEDFAEKLCLLINDEKLRKQMGLAGYEFATEKFSKQNEIAATEAYYFKLLHQKGYEF